MSLTAALVTASAAVATGMMWQWRRLGADTTPKPEDHAAAGPLELRPAVLIVTSSAQLSLMWPALGLGSPQTGYPNVVSAAYTDFGMSVEVQMLGGQSLKDWSNDNTRAALAAYFAVPAVTVAPSDPGFVRLDLRVYDTLADTAALPGLASAVDVDLEAVPVGVTEDFDTWRVRVLYGHILLAGATGSGKGSVLWSLLAALGPAIKAGLVDVYLADPKGGAEFGKGEDRLFVRFATDNETILAMLSEAEQIMRERLVRMRRAGLRKIVPSPGEPLILIIIDEAASLSSYATREEQQEFRRLTGLLLSQGRAAAVSVIAALQDPSKETMPNRQLFPVRIGLRLDEPTQNAMVHGQGARDRGARCDEISDQTPGVGYVGEDGTTEFVRVRAFYVSDDDIDAIVDAYSPAPEITGPAEDYSDFDPDDLGDADDGPVAA
ncbi:FtsK/SpoIIIE domain-containing protein [Nocardia sp. NBC_00508]|uniref:FtsK/SpoIIIE domain-containing protein n=1 Tax=Nocardia sp. NBC_00508 TaxID=2975992 RepID=UPI002E8048C0|nr:FtsK/SpoIIIE domain-containing protein [Nocardia sp. NBC_00508]WUD69623.1 FtsK/SpoIIIE domain-containing protein [Nocardia sp. NBC_00508]